MAARARSEAAADADPGRRLLVIVHPLIPRRRKRLLEATLNQLEALGCAVSLRLSHAPGEAELFARQAKRRDHDVVVVAGGDGTINEVVNGLRGTGMPLAILPMGTANVVAAEIGLAADAQSLAELIARESPRPVRPGRLDGRRFMMMAGVGVDAHAVASVHPALKRRTGKLAYVVAAFWQLLRYPFPCYDVRIDGVSWRATSVVVANGHYYAGTFVLAPEARLEQPGFHVCLLTRPGRWAALRYALAFVLGRLGRLADYHVIAARSVSISGPAGDPVQADGDIVASLPVEITVAPEAVDLIMPRSAPDGPRSA